MTLTTRVASTADLPFLRDADTHLSPQVLDEVVAQGRVMVATIDREVVGFLRWGLFWDEIPFMNLLWVLPDRRGNGSGTALVAAWEVLHAAAGHALVLTSTMSNERSQDFYRRLGYVDTGALLLPDEPAELILRKRLI